MDQTQFARNLHASASKRRMSIPVEYFWSAGIFWSAAADIFSTAKMPELAAAIESKIGAGFDRGP
jgi:hypothetical protein